MKTLIAYTSHHGATEKAGLYLKDKLENAEAIHLDKSNMAHLDDYDSIILGTSIHVGSIGAKARKFIQKFHDTLLQKKLGLFLCCMSDPEEEQALFDKEFPQDLREHAGARGLFGGEFNFEKMNFMERQIVKMVSGHKESVSLLRYEDMDRFITQFKGKSQ